MNWVNYNLRTIVNGFYLILMCLMVLLAMLFLIVVVFPIWLFGLAGNWFGIEVPKEVKNE